MRRGLSGRLIRQGFKVAVCEQMEDPAEARKRGSKAVVRRDVVRVVTPGTLTEDSLLDARGANRLAAVAVRQGRAAVAVVELSTGEVECLACRPRGPGRDAVGASARRRSWSPTGCSPTRRSPAALKAAGGVVQPMPRPWPSRGAPRRGSSGCTASTRWTASARFAEAEISALGLIAAYLETTQAGKLPGPVAAAPRGREPTFMAIDPATRASLEIDRTQRGEREGSLLACIDRTVTSGGARAAGRAARPAAAAIPTAIDHGSTRSTGCWSAATLRRDLRDGLKGVVRHGPGRCRGWRWAAAGRAIWPPSAPAWRIARGHRRPVPAGARAR